MQGNHTSLVPPAYAGVSLLLAWTYLTFYANTAGIEAAAPISLMGAAYGLSAALMVATLLIIAFSKRIGSPQLTSVVVKIVTPLGMSFGTFLLVTSGYYFQESFPVSAVVGSILTGIFSGIMTQQWILVYSRVGLRASVCSFPMLMAAAIGVSILLMYLPQAAMFVGMILLPIGSELMFHAARCRIAPYCDIDSGLSDRPMDFVLLLLPVLVFSFASGFLDFFSERSPYTFVFYGLIGFIPLVIAGVFIFLVNRESITPTLVVPTLFLIALFVPFFTLYGASPIARFISIGELASEVVLLLCAVGFAEFFSLSPFKTYALSRAVYAVVNSVGWYVAELIGFSFDSAGSSLASLTIVFVGVEVFSVVLIFAIVKAQKVEPMPHESCECGLSERDDSSISDSAGVSGHAGEASACGGIRQSSDASNRGDLAGEEAGAAQGSLCGYEEETAASAPVDPENAPSSDSSNAFELSCIDVGSRYGLSKREVDVLKLLARGFSSSRIQKELYIAAGTVNYHTRNIYAKTGVHSKQEIIDLVEENRCCGEDRATLR